jgi:hypothetical protein
MLLNGVTTEYACVNTVQFCFQLHTMRTRTADSAISIAELLSNTLAWPTPLCACENRIISSVFSNYFKERVNRFVFVYSSNLAPC